VLVRKRASGLQLQTPELEALVIRRGSRGYEIPKGHLEGSETPEQAAQRELREETGLVIEVSIGSLVGSDTYNLPKTGVRKTVHYYLAWCPRHAGPETFGLHKEAATKELLWVSLRELAGFNFKVESQKRCVYSALLAPQCCP